MNIQIASDLHLEFKENRQWFESHPLIPKGEILILAGDTYYLNQDFAKLEVIKKASEDFEQVFLIPGNHEFYQGYDVAQALSPFEIKILPNVTLLNNKSVHVGDYRFIFSTMWSHISNQIFEVTQRMMDFRCITYQGGNFYVHHFNELHQRAFEFISKEVQKTGKKIVVTHHLPSNQCQLPQFKGSLINEAFCVDKTDFIANHDIDFWIYGHSHGNLKGFEINGTQMVTNQFGYLHCGEHHDFNVQKVITLT